MKKIFNALNKSIYDGRQFLIQNICLNSLITGMSTSFDENKKSTELEKQIYKYSKELFLKCDPILTNDPEFNELRQEIIDDHNKNLNTYSISNFHIEYPSILNKSILKTNDQIDLEIKNQAHIKKSIEEELDSLVIKDDNLKYKNEEIEVIDDLEEYFKKQLEQSKKESKQTKTKKDNSAISIYSAHLFPFPNNNNTFQIVILLNKNEFEVRTYNFEFEIIDSKIHEIPKFFFSNSLYEDCFAYSLSKFDLLIDINNFLNSQEKYFKSLGKYILFLKTLLSQYKIDFPNLISKENKKHITIWVKQKNRINNNIATSEKNSNKVIDEMSPYDTKNQTYPKLAIKLENAPKIHLFIFLFYYRLKIEIPSIEQIANNMFILQGKKYIDTTTFDKILSKGYYYQKPNIRQKHIDSLIQYFNISENKELIPLFNNYVKEHFN